jgi:hypothetical protein
LVTQFHPNWLEELELQFVAGLWGRNEDRIVEDMAEAYSAKRLIFVQTYSELLHNAKNYHQEFIDRYD